MRKREKKFNLKNRKRKKDVIEFDKYQPTPRPTPRSNTSHKLAKQTHCIHKQQQHFAFKHFCLSFCLSFKLFPLLLFLFSFIKLAVHNIGWIKRVGVTKREKPLIKKKKKKLNGRDEQRRHRYTISQQSCYFFFPFKLQPSRERW